MFYVVLLNHDAKGILLELLFVVDFFLQCICIGRYYEKIVLRIWTEVVLGAASATPTMLRLIPFFNGSDGRFVHITDGKFILM